MATWIGIATDFTPELVHQVGAMRFDGPDADRQLFATWWSTPAASQSTPRARGRSASAARPRRRPARTIPASCAARRAEIARPAATASSAATRSCDRRVLEQIGVGAALHRPRDVFRTGVHGEDDHLDRRPQAWRRAPSSRRARHVEIEHRTSARWSAQRRAPRRRPRPRPPPRRPAGLRGSCARRRAPAYGRRPAAPASAPAHAARLGRNVGSTGRRRHRPRPMTSRRPAPSPARACPASPGAARLRGMPRPSSSTVSATTPACSRPARAPGRRRRGEPRWSAPPARRDRRPLRHRV